ncbi:hypothetical protein AB0J86_09035 [Micromonospora sp. NPDC049559]|uniref:hypothetical protein n=1 Tax=Micromonospora sp. NPDC049559 TaxID=3155923 RepID=UPI00341C92F6
MRTDTAALRAAAKRLRDEAAQRVVDAAVRSWRTEERQVPGLVFDRYGSLPGYRTAARAWRDELGNLAEALAQLADALDESADAYDRADAAAAARLGGGR